ncbi:MAG: hypothetical protein IPH07_25165 [Deltaproteobacteria bacterium]|nr:hypothetical protein [Deltaproteobacteria bacterium]
MGIFERFLSLWVALAIAASIGLGLVAPGLFEVVSRLEWARVNLVVAVLIWLTIYPMMLKVEPSCLKDVGKKPKGLALTLVVNWLIKPFTIAALSYGNFAISYGLARVLKLPFNVAAPAAMIGRSSFFELAVAVAISLFGLASGAALTTVGGVLIEVPVMLSLVAFANRTKGLVPGSVIRTRLRGHHAWTSLRLRPVSLRRQLGALPDGRGPRTRHL